MSNAHGETSTSKEGPIEPSFSLLTSLPKYPLSVVLSFLHETDGATSALLTNQFLYKKILPYFRCSPSLQISKNNHDQANANENANANANSSRKGNERRLKQIRHEFQPFKVQDPSELLARLNTRRLRKRIRSHISNTNHNHNHNHNHAEIDNHRYHSMPERPYPLNMSTDEIADYEWTQQFHNPSNIEENHLPSHYQHHHISHEMLRFPDSSYNKNNDNNNNNTDSQCQRHQPLDPSDDPSQCSFSFPSDEVTLLASYPRCGNTLLRSLFEKLTGTVTGSDTRPDRTLSLALSTQHDMTGEGVTNAVNVNSSSLSSCSCSCSCSCNSDVGVHLVKTHFPERRGYRLFDAHRIILLIRNPYDALESYFHMALTNTHTESLTDETFQKFHDTWEGLVKDEIKTWRDFHLYWLSLVRKSTSKSEDNNKSNSNTNTAVPLLVVRYEDLVRETREVMKRVLAFTMGKPLIHMRGKDGDGIGAFWEKRLDLVFGKNETDDDDALEHLGSYRPRSVGNELHKMNVSDNGNANDDHMIERNKKSSASASNNKNNNRIKIGKSLAKNRYSNRLLEHINQISGELLRTFGYDVLNQGFPQSMKSIPRRDRVLINVPLSSQPINPNSNSNSDSTEHNEHTESEKPFVRVNLGKEVRDPKSQYGRYMTTFRKMFTDNDAKPLPIVKKTVH